MYHDHHMHPLGFAQLLNGLDLMGSPNLNEVVARMAARAEEIEGLVVGQRLNEEGLSEGRLPTRRDLEQVLPDRPAILYRYCGHVAVANGAAMTAAHIDETTPDPPGGSLDRDGHGSPNGILRETAVALATEGLRHLVEPPADSEVLSALRRLPEMGIGSVTGIVSTDDPMWCGFEDELGTLTRLAADLPVDIDVLVMAQTQEALADAARRIGEAGGRLRFRGWKEFADGSFGGHTALLHEPFSDRPDTSGIGRLDHRHASTMADTALHLGGSVAIHAIGDLANDQVLDLYERLIREGADPERLRIEHASLLTPGAIERMAALGVTASVQPAFLASEHDWLMRRLGPDRIDRAYPFRSLLQAGVRLLGGSDSPVEMPDPAVGIDAAVQRHGINPTESLTHEQAEALFLPPAA